MDATLRRVALVATAAALAIVLGVTGVAALLVWRSDVDGGGVVVGASLVGALLVAGWVVQRYAAWEARALARHLDDLADHVDRLGSGEAGIGYTPVGVPEIDAVGAAVAAGAQRLSATLASEREFAADASHQLRTPLTALLMRLEEIGLTDDLDTVREEAAVAIEQAERLDTTVATLLTRTRRSGEGPRPVRVDQVLAVLQRHWQGRFEADHRSIAVTGERGLSVVTTEPALEQILGTLLENSLVHGGGTVTVDVRHSGPSVVIEVVDEGAGMTGAMARRAFQRHASTRSTGIGLPLARDLAERHGGRLELVAARPARFALFLSSGDDTTFGAPPASGWTGIR